MKKKTNPNKQTPDDLIQKMTAWEKENPKATLTEIEEAVDQELAKLREQLVNEVTQAKQARPQSKVVCPNCGTQMVKNGKKKRELTMKGDKQVAIERQQMRCLECGMTLFPPG